MMGTIKGVKGKPYYIPQFTSPPSIWGKYIIGPFIPLTFIGLVGLFTHQIWQAGLSISAVGYFLLVLIMLLATLISSLIWAAQFDEVRKYRQPDGVSGELNLVVNEARAARRKKRSVRRNIRGYRIYDDFPGVP
jgi:hypothetical protein